MWRAVFKFIRQHVFSAASITLLVVLLTFFFTVFEQVTGKTLHDWFQDRGGWYAVVSRWLPMRSQVYNFISWVLFGGAIIFYGVILYAIRQNRRDFGLLEEAINSHSKDPTTRIVFQHFGADRYLQYVEPHVKIRFNVINANIFPLTIEKLEGNIKIYNQPTERDPKIISRDLIFTPGREMELCIKQHIQPTTAERILRDNPENLFAVVNASDLAVCFIYKDQWGEEQRVKKHL
jgi:hypothetical protein